MKPLKQNSTLNKLVTFLSDGQYHDRASIAKKLAITRSAVSQAARRLRDYGIKINFIKGKGYALIEPLILLDGKYIKKNLQQTVTLDLFETLDSTNTYLTAFFQSVTPRLCFTELQTKGKGRMQRNWYSPFGKNIYLSYLSSFPCQVGALSGLSLVVSLAIVETLKAYHLTKPLLVKWPNDVMYADKKLSGILIELQAKTQEVVSAIIGIGINVNMLADEKHPIAKPWISLREMVGEYIDRNHLSVMLVNNLFAYLRDFAQQGLAPFIEKWQEVDYLRGRNIELQNAEQVISGNVKGIDHQGHLLIKLTDGRLQTFSSGETTIRLG